MAGSEVLSEQYARRFEARQAYREGVWQTLLSARLQAWVGHDQDVLDLGCGWGEFIRNVEARSRTAMDLNEDAAHRLDDEVRFLLQDCAAPWPLADRSLDVVFSSNFIEHLPDKAALEATLQQAHRCLRDDGRIILLGPNLRYTGGAYWDFWDHHLPLTDRSVVEVLSLTGFRVTRVVPRFLPYTMSEGRQAPLWMVRAYLALPLVWPLLGKQFLVMASKA
jgi:SAM-dependent methyltransferase